MVQYLKLFELFNDEALYFEIYDAVTLIYVFTLNFFSSNQAGVIKCAD